MSHLTGPHQLIAGIRARTAFLNYVLNQIEANARKNLLETEIEQFHSHPATAHEHAAFQEFVQYETLQIVDARAEMEECLRDVAEIEHRYIEDLSFSGHVPPPGSVLASRHVPDLSIEIQKRIWELTLPTADFCSGVASLGPDPLPSCHFTRPSPGALVHSPSSMLPPKHFCGCGSTSTARPWFTHHDDLKPNPRHKHKGREHDREREKLEPKTTPARSTHQYPAEGAAGPSTGPGTTAGEACDGHRPADHALQPHMDEDEEGSGADPAMLPLPESDSGYRSASTAA